MRMPGQNFSRMPITADREQVQLPAPTRAVDTEVRNAYAQQGIRPATATSEDLEQQLAAEGIGHWHIKAPAPPFTVEASMINA